jgi:hypothetical protein
VQVRNLILLLALIPSLALGETPLVNGLVASLNQATATIDPAHPATIDAQQLVTFGVQRPIGTPAIRCVIRLTDEQRIWLNPTLVGTIAEPADLYAVMQVAGPNVAQDQVKPPWLTELIQTCGNPFTLTVASPSVILAARTNPIAQQASTGFACACRGTGTCNWTPPLVGGGFGAATAAPKNFTIPAGLWSGAGCSLKTCVEMYGSDSMPVACK